MTKQWIEQVREKLNAYDSRKMEIDSTLGGLLKQIEIFSNHKLVDKQNLIWQVFIGDQIFTISENEITKEQIIYGSNEYGESIDTGDRKSVKDSLQKIIIEKLKSF